MTDRDIVEGSESIRESMPYGNMAICLALAGIPATDIREPEWCEAMTQERPEVLDYIAALCRKVTDIYHAPPATPSEGYEEDGFWVRERQIFYDTDLLREQQREAWRICPDCAGLGRIETSCNGRRALCLLIPRHACAKCHELGRALLQQTHMKKNTAQVVLLDGDRISHR